MNINTGARIIVQEWLHAKKEDVVHLITDETKTRELEAFKKACEIQGVNLKTTIIPSDCVQSAEVIDKMKEIMSYADVIIGATNYSFITSNAVKYALKKGTKFLSLPLSTNDGSSLLEQEFIRMSPIKAKFMSIPLIRCLNKTKKVHITTKKGTDITFDITQRKPGLFNGSSARPGDCASASFEVYVAPNETMTNGRVILDGSMGYIGLVDEDVEVIFKDGYITSIQDNPSGRRLKEFIKSFDDKEIYCAGELGIGLNTISRCQGKSYIEDESTYSTFHIGLGRNKALGGSHDAKGHFDIVTHNPTITTDVGNIMIDGNIVGLRGKTLYIQ